MKIAHSDFVEHFQQNIITLSAECIVDIGYRDIWSNLLSSFSTWALNKEISLSLAVSPSLSVSKKYNPTNEEYILEILNQKT